MFKIISSLLQNAKTKTNANANANINIQKQIGRWCIPKIPGYFQTATLIMDRSNEDHCGTCGNNLLIKNYYLDSVANNEITKHLEEEIYYYPYTM